MRTFTRILQAALCLAATLPAMADVPFTPTTLNDGQFASDTKWYSLSIGASSLRISDNGTESSIGLGGTLSLDDENLWCFVGNDTDGYRIFNKQAGPGKALAAPVTMSDSNGKTSYAILKDTTLTSTDTNLWDFKQAEKTSTGGTISVEDGWFVSEHGHSSNILNNRDGKLAFWSAGYDDGSAIAVGFMLKRYTVDLSNGSFTATNANGTFASKWSSTATDPQLTVSCGVNNMSKGTDGTNINISSGKSTSSTYTFSAGTSYAIYGYGFKCKNASSSSATLTLSTGESSYSVTDTETGVAVTGLKNTTAQFTLSGDNHAALCTEFYVDVCSPQREVEPQFNVFESKGLPTNRIPAIAKAYNGDLIAVADLRYNGSDIGGGKLDLRGRISKDNGATWGDIFTIVKGDDYTDTSVLMCTGFGDPCIVGDSESPRVLMMSCSGNVMFPSGTRTKHQAIARFYSEDNGQTWSKPVDISESIYSQFDNCAIGSAKSMFVGSGRIFQSRTFKAGKYYRLYCSVLFKDINNVNKNYVLYSDDFGENWSVLGGVDVAPIPSGADEPKTEELPDGSILCSSRVTGGRYYNIFSFTDTEKAEGSWGTMAFSGASNNGVKAENNACNGEVLVLPAVRRADNKDVYLILQSVPFGSGRTNVGIYYKELGSFHKFANPDSLAANWDGRHQASYIGSAYSTMILQADNHVGFLYEDDTFSDGAGYTIAYKNYSLEQITDSLYSYKADVARDPIVADGAELKLISTGKYVGCPTEASTEKVKAAYDTYAASPSKKNYEALNKAIADVLNGTDGKVSLNVNQYFRLRNSARSNGTLYLTLSGTNLTAATLSESNTKQLFAFIPAETEGEWYIKCGDYYIGKTPAVETRIPVTKTQSAAATYTVASTLDGLSSLSCTAPTNSSYPAIHLAGDNTRLVPWTAQGSPASLWYIEPTDIETAIRAVERETEVKELRYYDISGRRLDGVPAQGVYITSDRKKHVAR